MNPNTNDNDTLILFLLGAAALSAGAIPLGTFLHPLRTWLLEHHVLVHADQALFTLPGWNAGPDLPRLALLGCALAFLAVVASMLTGHRKHGPR